MHMRHATFVAAFVALTATLGAGPAISQTCPGSGTPLTYPVAKKVDQTDTYFGTTIADPYRWLEDANSAETKAWVDAENQVTQAYLATIPQRAAIRERLTQLWNYERYSVPFREGGRYFYSRNDGLQNQAVLYTMTSLNDAPRLLLDPNKLAADGTVALAGLAVSPDGSRAYVTDAGNSVLWTLDTATNTLLRADPVGLTPVGVAVSPDGTHLYVSDLDEGVVTVLLAGPILTGISPASGPAAGGNTITLTGTNLAGVTAVRVDGAQGTNIVVNPAGTQLTFTAPPGTGTVTVSVTSPAGDSNALTYTYTAAPTTTTLVSSANPSAPGAVVSFTATVAPVPPATGSPTGTVTFTVDGVPQAPVALVGGQATLSTSALAEGSHTVSAHYNGSASFAPSTSPTLTQTVAAAATTTTLVSSANPSAPGAVVSFTATVAPVPPATGSPTGTVTFTVDGVPQAPVALVGGQATLTTSLLGGGSHTVSAHYNGSASFAPSTSNTLTVTVPPTGTTLTAAPAVATLGTDRQAHIRSLSATLTDQSGRPVAGQPVVFTIGGQQVAVATTDASGVATSTNVVVDPQFLLRSGSRYTATYNGGTAYQGSSASAGVTLS